MKKFDREMSNFYESNYMIDLASIATQKRRGTSDEKTQL